MAEPYVWGALPRANNDPTVIDEAISIAVTAHNNDADAHLAAGQALQSHRAAEIIDHLAESVVNDKIRIGARTYIAIVGDEDGDDFDNIEDACDFAYQYGSGTIKVRKGNYTPVRPLKVAYGVDIVGEGPEETVIDLDANDAHGLNFAQNYELEPLFKPLCYGTADSNIIEYYPPSPYDNADTYGIYFTNMPVASGEAVLCMGPVSGIEVELYEPLIEDIADLDADIIPSLSASTSSTSVTIHGYEYFSGFDKFIGLTLMSDTVPLGEVLSYDGAGHFILASNALSNVTMQPYVRAQGRSGRESIVSGVTFVTTESDYLITADGELGRAYLRDCIFRLGNGLFRPAVYVNTIASKDVTIEDAIIKYYGSSPQLEMFSCVIRNTTFQTNTTNSIADIGGIGAFFENCSFDIYIANIRAHTLFEDCDFTQKFSGTKSVGAFNSGSDPTTHVTFTGCSFATSGSANLLFYGEGIIVTGCYFYTGSGTVGLASGSKYSTFSCNVYRATLATIPSTCVGVGNVQQV